MTQNEYGILLDLLENRAGEALRVVAQYDADDTYLLYRRHDLDENDVRLRLEQVAASARNRPALIGSMRRNADLELYDNYVLLHWAQSASRGLLVSLEPDIARQLNGFIKDCNNAINTSNNRTHE